MWRRKSTKQEHDARMVPGDAHATPLHRYLLLLPEVSLEPLLVTAAADLNADAGIEVAGRAATC